MTRIQRFWSKVNKKGPYSKAKKTLKRWSEIKNTRCYEWIAGCGYNGYGAFDTVGEGQVKAHRFAYLLYHGKHSLDGLGPDGKPWQVLHKCDNKKCVREEHLFKGTHQDNMDDKKAKGREAHPKGSSCSWSKLTEHDVLKIRRLYKTGKFYQRELAKKYSVSRPTIGLIVNKVNWCYLKEVI